MAWVDLVALLAIIQLVVFGVLVGWARGRYAIAAPTSCLWPVTLSGTMPVFVRLR